MRSTKIPTFVYMLTHGITCVDWYCRNTYHVQLHQCLKWFGIYRTSFDLKTGPSHHELIDNAQQAVLDGTSKWSCKIACTGILTKICTVLMLVIDFWKYGIEKYHSYCQTQTWCFITWDCIFVHVVLQFTLLDNFDLFS